MSPLPKEMVLATGNAGKAREFAALLNPLGIALRQPREAGFSGEVEETGSTFRENAWLKARTLAEATGLAALADDSGLEVAALGGRPGVRSARFAGPGATDMQNRARLLGELRGASDRSARFVCTLCLVEPGREPEFFSGVCAGRIAAAEKGLGGFGYDPVFIPEGEQRTFAEMTLGEKEALSHRGRAIAALLAARGG